MLLDFDIEKAIAATSYLIRRNGGTSDMFVLIKKLYYADRTALIKWGKPITGDSFASLKKGPVVSKICYLFKGKGSEANLIEWDTFIHMTERFKVSLRKIPDETSLSERELAVLDESDKTIDKIKGSISDWLHENCPEWTDPHGGSLPIDPNVILRKSGKDEEEIQEVEEANLAVQFAKYLIGPR